MGRDRRLANPHCRARRNNQGRGAPAVPIAGGTLRGSIDGLLEIGWVCRLRQNYEQTNAPLGHSL